MKVLVEFLDKSQQHHILDRPQPISSWITEPIAQFPLRRTITERHEYGIQPAFGLKRLEEHTRKVTIFDERGGVVGGCDADCWDPRRFGSKLITVDARSTRKGLVLKLIEIVD